MLLEEKTLKSEIDFQWGDRASISTMIFGSFDWCQLWAFKQPSEHPSSPSSFDLCQWSIISKSGSTPPSTPPSASVVHDSSRQLLSMTLFLRFHNISFESPLFMCHLTNPTEVVISNMANIVVIGFVAALTYEVWHGWHLTRAGVSGLTTALLLSKKGHSVTIVAKHSPGDYDIEYTSPWAGADYMPYVPTRALYEIFTNFHEPFPRI